ncbi:hypothetical protein ZIOFF_007096 [Zingiber officinale]|uniref:Uncharacterized protein n=1 Tax=Zingiber officinale TaxID=94328 RepID=A0A8J5LPN5_ZINOF|nr:hypothetical protein ZIOFF_007096 [Zingiber officinale]
MKRLREGKHFLPNLTHLAIVLFVGLFLSAPLWIPRVRSCRVPKCLFLLCNIVIVFYLAGEWKLMCSSPTTDVYDEYTKASSERQAEWEDTESSTTVGMNSVREEEGLEEEEEEKGWCQIDKKAEEFIARINWQRKLEERRLLLYLEVNFSRKNISGALRDGCRTKQDATILVPDDIISIIVSAYAQLLERDALKIDQFALTREYLPVTKNPGDEEFSTDPMDNPNQVGHFQKVLTDIVNFCICTIAIGMVVESIFMYPIQHKRYRDEINNLLVLLIGAIPIFISTLGVDKNLIDVFVEGVDKEHVILLAVRASRTDNQDAIEAAVVGMLANPND